mmetsp:Transcript_9663/g.37728  ORF Transcript_9663/g.37728 Transcript_9663/m.37728 type:complete len:290 (-) Transcript_9663:2379-3248(-)
MLPGLGVEQRPRAGAGGGLRRTRRRFAHPQPVLQLPHHRLRQGDVRGAQVRHAFTDHLAQVQRDRRGRRREIRSRHARAPETRRHRAAGGLKRRRRRPRHTPRRSRQRGDHGPPRGARQADRQERRLHGHGLPADDAARQGEEGRGDCREEGGGTSGETPKREGIRHRRGQRGVVRGQTGLVPGVRRGRGEVGADRRARVRRQGCSAHAGRRIRGSRPVADQSPADQSPAGVGGAAGDAADQGEPVGQARPVRRDASGQVQPRRGGGRWGRRREGARGPAHSRSSLARG